ANNNGQSFFVGTTGANLNTGMYQEMTEGFVRDLESALPGQNIPNSFENSSLISFRILHDYKDASIEISESAGGKIVSVASPEAGETQWTLETGFSIVVIILSLCLWMELLWIRKA